MSVRVLTLFGEEIIPEQINAVGRPAKTKKAKATPEATEEEEPVIETEEAPIENQVSETPPAENEPVTTITTDPVAATPKKKAVAEPVDKKDFLDGWSGEKQYYTIGEVATLFEVKTSNIRFWTNEFALKVRTTRKGDRLYTPDQVREIRAIYHLVKEKKYTISGAKAKLKEKTVAVESIDLKKSLLHLRNKLLTIRNQLS